MPAFVSDVRWYFFQSRPFIGLSDYLITEMKDYTNEKTNQQIGNNFTYHAPKEGQTEKYELLRETAKAFAQQINANCPDSREKAVALTELETSVMWANAAIARNE